MTENNAVEQARRVAALELAMNSTSARATTEEITTRAAAFVGFIETDKEQPDLTNSVAYKAGWAAHKDSQAISDHAAIHNRGLDDAKKYNEGYEAGRTQGHALAKTEQTAQQTVGYAGEPEPPRSRAAAWELYAKSEGLVWNMPNSTERRAYFAGMQEIVDVTAQQAVGYATNYEDGHSVGWNAAIDRILAEGNDLRPDFKLKQGMVRDFIEGLRK